MVLEELGGDASKINVVKRSVTSVCADASEDQPTSGNYEIQNDEGHGISNSTMKFNQAKVHLQCGPGQSIGSIKFASFGTPSGICGSFKKGTCDAANSHAVLEKALP